MRRIVVNLMRESCANLVKFIRIANQKCAESFAFGANPK